MSDDFFNVSIPLEVRPKLQRLAKRSRRSMGNVVAVLIEKEDEAAPIWNIAVQPQATPACASVGTQNEDESAAT